MNVPKMIKNTSRGSLTHTIMPPWGSFARAGLEPTVARYGAGHVLRSYFKPQGAISVKGLSLRFVTLQPRDVNLCQMNTH